MGRKCAGHGVGAGFERLLVDAVMRVGGERRALAGFEVHDVVADLAIGADAAAVQRTGRPRGPRRATQGDAEAAIGGFGSGDGLKEQVDGRAGIERVHLGGDVGQHAALHGNLEPLAQGIDHAQQARGHGHVVARGVDADDRVAGAEQQAIENGRGNAGGVVGGVVGLEPRAQPAGQANGGAEARDHADFARGGNQVLHAHQLAHGRGHLRREAGSERGEALSAVASSESSQLRSSPTVNERMGAKASASCVSTISRVTSSVS